MRTEPTTITATEPVLVVLRDRAVASAIATAFEKARIDHAVVDDAPAAVDWLHDHDVAIVVSDFTGNAAPGPDVLALLRGGQQATACIAIVEDNDASIARAMDQGADDFVRCPVRAAEVVARVREKLRHQGTAEELARRAEGAKVVLELTQALSSTLDLRSILFTVVQRIAEVARVERCSIVLVQEDSARGYVVAASDNRDVYDLPIDVSLYPEIQRVLSSRQSLVIDDASEHPLFELVSGGVSAGGFRSLALLPIVLEDRSMGVLFLRGRKPTTFREHEMFLARTVANATAIALRNAHVLTSLKAESHAHSVARIAAERRLSSVQKYFDFFHAAADGLLVLDAGGRVLFANAKAAEITCRAPADLHHLTFRELFDPKYHDAINEVYAGFSAGKFPQMVDLAIRRSMETICDRRVLQVSFSGALWQESNVVLVSFRDVTADRGTAVELQKTKEFLERVIDSSADAIVAADNGGTITLFSRAAERLYGYRADEVIGIKNARDLYPEGIAHQVKKLMGSTEHGGAGRLEGYRTEVLGKDGKTVPVLLSAAMIVENGTAVGSVGVFTDQRDKLVMERKLVMAQEELRTREKQSFIAELAGAAAHELNQPLTSVSGYAQLILRRLPSTSPLVGDVRVILAESERMADIVRKIGKITRYETKTYVGAAKIVDLDKASDEENGRKALTSSRPPPSNTEGLGPASR
ncbi:MAG: PAS domain S-box protein [Polyangiaceae bacterium]|nr:PAS domain S-box protein [Polyangiaceae bacterium]